MSQTRINQLNKRFYDVLNGKVQLDPRNSRIFLEAICAQEDTAKCVDSLVSSPHGLPSIQNAMRFDLSLPFFNGLATTTLEHLLRTANLGGGVLDHILITIVEPPIFWSAFAQGFEAGALTEKAQLVFAKILDRLIALKDKNASSYRELASKPSIINRLVESSEHEVREIAHHINHVLAAFASGGVLGDPCGPGGRHDNDFPNFRDIAILPTADEILSTQPPFIRPASVLDDPEVSDSRVADYLDNTFRMLREDMIYDMREELQIAQKKKPGRHRGLHIDGLSMVGVYTGSQDKGSRWGLVLQCHHDFPQLQGLMDLDDRKKFLLDDPGLKILRNQSLACIMADEDITSFATILRVDDLLAQKPPKIVLQLEGEASTSKTLFRLSTAMRVQLLQIDTALFAYEPILKALQKTQLVPLSDELLFWEEGKMLPPPSIQIDEVVQPLTQDPSTNLQSILDISKPVQLDRSQVDSLLAGLRQRVALIQGPPGTGKSFIGALLAKAIHEHTGQTILVVCYTNHALDQFLDDLIGIGIAADTIVRIGGRASATVQHLSLQSQERVKQRRSRAEWTLIEQAKSRSSFLVERLQNSFQALVKADRAISPDDILTHIEFEDPEFWDAFQVPSEPDGLQIVRKGKRIQQDYLLSQWSKGWDAGLFRNHPTVRDAETIWSMDPPSRQACLAKWKMDIVSDVVTDMCNVGRDYNNAQDELVRRFGESTVALLKQKRIIGCTTTGAAKYAEDLAAVSPDVLLVEEAGEILESHILTALGEKTSQMILIGDHKQLRPKVNNYELTVEKGEGFDLNRSLFERLVEKGFPHQTLTTQHRMRPEISAFIRELTYPDLIDHPSTQNRPDICGVQSNIIFVNHAHPEDEDTRIADRRDAGSTSSKQNTYEAEMVLKIVRYLKQQGYKGTDMVVLTPYLGQLFKIRDALQNEYDPVLNDLDANDLQRAGLLGQTGPVATTKAHQAGVRLATIDNYQGEESNIVIASLTRSNPNNSIGFMDSPERLNVLLSRARNGLILIGNSHTFLNSKRGAGLWEDFFSMLKKERYVYDGFPIKCQKHPTRTVTLTQPGEFDSRSPDGGCTDPCGVLLKCQLHACLRRCHPSRPSPGQPDVHSSMLCAHPYKEKCPADVHPMSWKCHQGRPATCSACDRLAKALERQAKLDMKAQEQRDKAQREYDMKMIELQAKLQYQQDMLNDMQAQKDRQNELKQKEKEIEDMKQQIRDAESAAKKAAAKAIASSQNPSQDAANDPAPSTSSAAAPPRPMFPSAARDKWEDQKRLDGVQNDAIDKIMDMTGLEQVKEKILRIKGSLDTMRRQDVPIDKERINLVLLGNPGTGKTTVARLYAKFLESIKALPGDAFLETTGSKLSFEGVNGAQKLVDDALKAGGGAIFIDEAYQLVSEHDQSGKQVLDFLLAEMENRVGTLVFILAGYSKEMEKFFEHNPGLLSRVPHQLTFADYTDKELLTMLEDLLYKRYGGRMKAEDGINGLYARIAIRRLGRGRGRPGFGNARALQNTFAKICERQAERVEKERRSGMPVDDFLLTKEDFIGPDPSQVLPNSAPWAKLQGLIGLESVKDSVRQLFALLETNYQRELAEKELIEFSLNRVFLGSPGTGKTSVAKLYGQILADLGMLSNGEVVVKNPADFIGAHLGESEKNTKSILASTRGKVLVIDEAYMLYSKNASDPYKTSVIDTMVAEIQSVPGEDRCVLLLGYKDQMEEMFQNVNPGLARRFAIENAFNFEDFTEPQLMKIFEYKLKDQDLAATGDAKEVAHELLSRMRNRPNFGNAGEVENLLGQTKARYQKRVASVPASKRLDVVFEPQDIDPDFDRSQNASENLAEMFADVVGCEDVIRKLDGYQKIARMMKEKGLDMRTQIPSNFVFKGPPGTGKTTTARKLGKVYYDMGFLASKEVVECSATDLVGQYVGHTGPKTKGVFEKALGKVLFIDEAYRLSEGHYAKEAMDEIVGLMTHERFMNKLVIILAGYDNQMNELLAVNPGLSSRFSEEIIFQNMSPEQCLELLDKDLQKEQFIVPELSDKASPTYVEMQATIAQMSALPSWGNARDVKTLGKRLVRNAFANMASGGTSESLSAEEALSIMKSMLQEQLTRHSIAHAVPSGSMGMASMNGPASPPPSISTSTSQASKRAPPPPPQSSPPNEPPKQSGSKNTSRADTATKQRSRRRQTPAKAPAENQPPSCRVAHRDAGVSDAIWNQLQADITAQEQAKKRAAEEGRRLEQEVKKAEKQKQAARARAAALERAMAAAKDNVEQKRREITRQLEEAQRREAEVRAARERAVAALKKKQQEEEEKRRKELEMQQKLDRMGRCPAGYQWIRQEDGYRCAGGSHFMSHDELSMC